MISLIMNSCVVIMTVFGIYAMFTGWYFMGKCGELDDTGLEMFKYFTIDSNVLAGICCLIVAIAQIKNPELSAGMLSIKLMGTSAVTLTLLVTVIFLVPQFKDSRVLFYNSNLFFHLLTPLFCLISFVFFERSSLLSFGAVLLGVLPTALYAVYYIGNILRHIENGQVSRKYDFYNFCGGKAKNIVSAACMVIGSSFVISLLVWFVNRIGM